MKTDDYSILIKTRWLAVCSLFLGVTSLIAAEFTPVSLLTPIAQDLHITEGMAGQSVTMVGAFAVVASLTLSPLTQTINRRYVLLSLSLLLVLSNLLIACAPNYAVFLLGRAILGLCVGGFWSMASAVALQLATKKDLPKALSIIYAGVSVATIIALPLASYLGAVISWRKVFLLASIFSLIAFICQYYTLPSLKIQKNTNFKNMLSLLEQNWILAGIGATICSYGGYHVFFTYLRPFLEYSLTPSTATLTTILLIFGLANCFGTFIAGFLLAKWFRTVMITTHLILLIIALLFLISPQPANTIVLTLLWGFMFGFIPVGWSVWIARTLADKAEIMGGLSVASIQFSIGLAAAVGGLMLDHIGMHSIFMLSAIILANAIILIKLSFHLFYKSTHRDA